MSERVFVDTSAYYALVDQNDMKHGSAIATAHQLGQSGADVFTSNFVVAETHTLILNRLGRDSALVALARIYASATRIVRATEADERRGRDIVAQQSDKDYSLVDTISFAIMERLHLRLAWTYDHHFHQFGFTLAN